MRNETNGAEGRWARRRRPGGSDIGRAVRGCERIGGPRFSPFCPFSRLFLAVAAARSGAPGTAPRGEAAARGRRGLSRPRTAGPGGGSAPRAAAEPRPVRGEGPKRDGGRKRGGAAGRGGPSAAGRAGRGAASACQRPAAGSGWPGAACLPARGCGLPGGFGPSRRLLGSPLLGTAGCSSVSARRFLWSCGRSAAGIRRWPSGKWDCIAVAWLRAAWAARLGSFSFGLQRST